MRIPQKGKDKKLLARFSDPGRCEYKPCDRECYYGRDPAHVFSCGLGGGHRIDHELNLVSLCRSCHSLSHAGGRPTQADLLAIVSAREGVPVAAIVEWIHVVKRLPRGSDVPNPRKVEPELDATKVELCNPIAPDSMAKTKEPVIGKVYRKRGFSFRVVFIERGHVYLAKWKDESDVPRLMRVTLALWRKEMENAS